MRNRSDRIVGAIMVALVCVFAVVAHAQRRYVETRTVSTGTATGLSAFANQLAPVSPDKVPGMCLQYDVDNKTVWGPCGSLPAGTPGQILGVGTATAWQASNGTLYAGTHVRFTKGTGTATDTAAGITESPRVHVIGVEPSLPVGNVGQVLCTTGTGSGASTSKAWCAQTTGAAYSFSTGTPAAVATSGAVGVATSLSRSDHAHAYTLPFGTSTPVAVGTSGSVGTSASVSRSDHKHKGDGNDKVSAYSGSPENYLESVVGSSNGSIDIFAGSLANKLDFTAKFGSTANTVCQGNDSRLSNAREPTAHAATHKGGGSDAIAEATTSVAGLLSASDKSKLNSTTTTPATYSIPATGSTQYLTAWIQAASGSVAGLLSTAHYNLLNGATATPTASRVPIADGSGTLNSWVTGRQASIRLRQNASQVQVVANGTWQQGASVTFTATGTKFRVHASGTASTGSSSYTARICGICVAADTGSSASTLRGPCGWMGSDIMGNVFFNTIIPGQVLLGDVNADTYFTLAAGTVTIAVRGYALGADCYYSASAMSLIIEEYN